MAHALFEGKVHLCPIGIPHEYPCSFPNQCDRPDKCICNRCLLSPVPDRQELVRVYEELYGLAVNILLHERQTKVEIGM